MLPLSDCGSLLPLDGGEASFAVQSGSLLPHSYTTYASANPICAAIIIRYMWRHDG